MARRSMGGGLPVGLSTVYKGCSAAAAVPAIAMPKSRNFATPCGASCVNLVSIMLISPASGFYSAAHCDATVDMAAEERTVGNFPAASGVYLKTELDVCQGLE